MKQLFTNQYFKVFVIVLSLLVSTVMVLKISGRNWLAPSQTLKIWYGEANGAETSQHLLDPYSFTHFLHGVVICWFLLLIARNIKTQWGLVCAIALESIWEVVENSEAVIQHYREATFALGYYGDSIINSLSDIVLCSTGFLVASKIGFKKSLALFVLVEIFLILWIKDSLVINIIMLIYPVQSIKTWQMAI
ncbi:MAG: hypothetical protein PWR01_2279 [Clostridiales bacterium]|nr:hypothetical protein [Clostridiales bacterium]MDN5281206.1 hypothetical protein [Candidatus Ozemobacter sp.]